ncbi:integrase [Gossypium australe]|uniref:Integrase n=1 Tax=Gossypium australe TaxID=47621 RepID=A0A5B6VMW5_9ROSI|nr:integrase [Gossypium australe]
MNTCLTLEQHDSILAKWKAKLVFLQKIQELQKDNPKLQAKWKLVEINQTIEFSIGDNESLYFRNQLKRGILYEPHSSTYTMHPGSNKMYDDLKPLY